MRNGDVLGYLNSRDEREYLGSIGYEFGTLEAMWLVWHSSGVTVAGRHGAWRDIIDTMPDCAIGRRNNVDASPSAHAFMREIMGAENGLLDAFAAEEDGAVWFAFPWGSGIRSDCMYASHRDCLADIGRVQEDGGAVVAAKKWLREDAEVWVTYDGGLAPIAVECSGGRLDEQKWLLAEMDGFAFDIPSPFKYGDVVVCATDGCLGNCRGIFTGPKGPFVLTHIATERKDAERYFTYADSCDMTAGGLWQGTDGRFYAEVMHSYIDLEYWREEPTGVQRALAALGILVRGEAEPELFLDVYDTALAQARAEELTNHLKGEYLREIVGKLGF